eukprot:m.180786 g.180786  ORF g.180786 m.180786 type:complete len:148 (-) comp14952_c2_seq6:28-471(-)
MLCQQPLALVVSRAKLGVPWKQSLPETHIDVGEVELRNVDLWNSKEASERCGQGTWTCPSQQHAIVAFLSLRAELAQAPPSSVCSAVIKAWTESQKDQQSRINLPRLTHSITVLISGVRRSARASGGTLTLSPRHAPTHLRWTLSIN